MRACCCSVIINEPTLFFEEMPCLELCEQPKSNRYDSVSPRPSKMERRGRNEEHGTLPDERSDRPRKQTDAQVRCQRSCTRGMSWSTESPSCITPARRAHSFDVFWVALVFVLAPNSCTRRCHVLASWVSFDVHLILGLSCPIKQLNANPFAKIGHPRSEKRTCIV